MWEHSNLHYVVAEEVHIILAAPLFDARSTVGWSAGLLAVALVFLAKRPICDLIGELRMRYSNPRQVVTKSSPTVTQSARDGALAISIVFLLASVALSWLAPFPAIAPFVVAAAGAAGISFFLIIASSTRRRRATMARGTETYSKKERP